MMNLSSLSLLALALLAAGCASIPPADAGLTGTWRLVSIEGDAPGVSGASLTFGADGRVSGTTGCNRLSGTYNLASDGGLRLSPLATTRMACAPAAMDQERRVLDALAEITRAEVEDDRLALWSERDRLLVFEASAPDGAASRRGTLTGTVTYLPRIALPPDAVVTVRLLDVSRADAPSTTLAQETISADGHQVPFSFALDYDTGEIEPRRRYAIRAEIRSASGDLLWTTDTVHPVLTNGAPSSGVEVRLVQATDAPDAPLAGPEWALIEIRPAAGAAESPQGEGRYTIVFLTSGQFTGRADCNRYGGAFEVDSTGDLILTNTATTLAACVPPSSSHAFFGVLGQVIGFDIAGGQLQLQAADGSALVFEREGQMPPQETGRDIAYTCDSPDGPFTFRTRTGPGELAVWLPARFEGREGGTYRVLGQARSASGAKYQDGPVTVWMKGTDEALLEVDGEAFVGCRPAP